MSFSTEVKNELARLEIQRKCCSLSEIAGFIRMCGRFPKEGGIILVTENPAVAKRYIKIIRSYFSAEVELTVREGSSLKKNHSYLLAVKKGEMSAQIMRETGVLTVREGRDRISEGIYEGLLKTKCCRKAYLRGAFLGAGSITDPSKGYHIEFVCGAKPLADDMVKLINSFSGIYAKRVMRRESYAVYVKDSEQITDIMNIMGAHGQLLNFENTRILKELRNKVNRINNCDSGNIGKIAEASARQLQAIKKIEETKGLAYLPKKLREAAQLRLDNPEAALAELGSLATPPLKKAGINKRLVKIEEIAEKI